MKLQHGAALLGFSLITLAGPGLAEAATATCMSVTGSCEVSNDGFDWTDCTCADGSGGGGGGGNMWAGLTEMDLEPICEGELMSFCGPFPPPEFIECWGLFGSCIIDNDPEDSLECSCYDGTSGSIVGGMAWAGYTDAQLLAECEARLDTYCLPPVMSQQCSNANGECTIANVPDDFLACECLDGSGGSFGGGNAWAGYTELQLHTECGAQLVGLCGGAPPPPLWLECSSGLGSCIIDNDPESTLECTCANGDTISGGRGEDWSGLSEAELLMECDEQLYDGCFVEAGTGTGDTGDTGDTDDTDDTDDTGGTGDTDDTDDTDDTGNTDDTGPGLDSGGTSAGSTDTSPPATSGDETTGDETTGGDGGAVDGDGSGCSCSADGGSPPGGWALALGALLGLVRRRRRASRPA